MGSMGSKSGGSMGSRSYYYDDYYYGDDYYYDDYYYGDDSAGSGSQECCEYQKICEDSGRRLMAGSDGCKYECVTLCADMY